MKALSSAKKSCLASGVILTRSTPVFDLVKGEILKSTPEKSLEIPAGAVVVQGSRQITERFRQRKRSFALRADYRQIPR